MPAEAAHAREQAVVHGHVLVPVGDDPVVSGIDDDHVRIRSGEEGSLSWIQAEAFRGVFAQEPHKVGDGDAALGNPFVPRDAEKRIHAGRAVRGPEGFGKERFVGGGGVPRRIGGDDLYFAIADRFPERLAVCLLAQGRGHLGEVAAQRKLAVVQRQIMGAGFGEKRGHRAPLPEQPDGFEGFLAGDMRQVDVAARDRGQRKHAEDGLGLGNVGVRRGVIAGVLAPLGNGLGFQMFKDGVVFRMEGEEGLFARDQFHEVQDLVVLQFHAPLPVGCERLEGNDPARDQLGDGVVGLFHDVGGQGAVQPEVDAGTGFPFPDEVVDGLNQPALFAPCGDGPDVGDDGGDAAGQGRPRQAVDAVGIDGVVVRVDDAGQHVAPGGVDDPVGPHLGAAREEAFHPFPGNEDVQRAHGSGINDDAVCDQSRTHGVSPVKHPLPCPAA